MQSALHTTTKVLPGNRIEVQLPSLLEGEQVEVFIVLPQHTPESDSLDADSCLDQMVRALDHPTEMTTLDTGFSMLNIDTQTDNTGDR